MERRKDLGDQYPSDIGDLVPNSPTQGYSEQDYSVKRPEIPPIKEISTFDDRVPVDSPIPQVRHAFYGLIMEPINEDGIPETYNVLRQDGKQVIVQLAPRVGQKRYPENTTVLFVRDEGTERYVGIANYEYEDLDTLSSYSNQSVTVDSETESTVPIVGIVRPKTGSGITKVNDNSFVAEEGGIYEIEYSIEIEPVARFIAYRLLSDTLAGVATAAVENFHHGYNPGSPVNVYSSEPLKIDDTGYAIWDDQTGRYVSLTKPTHLQTGSIDCGSEQAPTFTQTTKLIAGNGLAETVVDDAKAWGISIDVISAPCTQAGGEEPQSFKLQSALQVGAGLSVTTVDDCSIKIESSLSLQSVDCGGEVDNDGSPPIKPIEKILIGSGLKLTPKGSCDAQVDLDISVGQLDCNGSEIGEAIKLLQKLLVGQGLRVQGVDSCSVKITLDSSVPISEEPAYLLGFDENGCLIRVATDLCEQDEE